ncbi:hypothetical protein F5X71_16465 [Nocardia brasiliensis]|uniref:Uncharacterized protein n=1 Tax=Nocardia brasiliensis TaxID=37326 RepID=A0A6G9XRZ8_NOCBR|nr:hypothetical protein [Nocardia brasiliensis]QIS03704.1 hypothetical protein F5X71_16465 [Nocardia brasiliensis]
MRLVATAPGLPAWSLEESSHRKHAQPHTNCARETAIPGGDNEDSSHCVPSAFHERLEMINTAVKTAFTATTLCALMATAPLAHSQPEDQNAPPGDPAGPPASATDAPTDGPGDRRHVKISTGYGLGNFSGNVYFASADQNHGGFVFHGTSDDTENNDQEIYLQVSVEGYSAVEFYNPVDKDKNWSKVVWDPQAIRTNEAWMRVCNSDAWSDTCSEWKHFKR